MPVDISYPGVYVEEIPSGVRTIAGVETSTAAFAGAARVGPTDRAELVSSWTDFESKFGGLDSCSLLGYSVRHYFDNGGRAAYIARIANSDPAVVLKPNEPDFEQALLPSDGVGGLYHLNKIDLFNLLCVPGETNPSVIVELQKFCRERRAFLIADCAKDAKFDDLEAGPGIIAGEDSINSAFYFPWVLAPDPLDNNTPREFPPCGFVAGIYSRTDSTRGVWKAPAGTDASLKGITGIAPEKEISEAENGVLNPKAINCIRTFPVHGTVLWGSRTLRGADEHASEWKYVPVRRMALFIEESLKRGLTWTVFEPNDEPLWAEIRLNVGAFMHNLFRGGAFQGSTPRDAYFVKCDRETTTQNDIDSGVVNIFVGFAPLKPAEFVIIKIQQMAGQEPEQGRSGELPWATYSGTRPYLDPFAQPVEPKATRDDLRLPPNQLALLRQVVEEVRNPPMVYDRSGAGAITAFFVGERGTGKTMAAEVIAGELGLKLLRIDLSAVVSKYIGETEKNIRRVFEESQGSGAVLFLDEADALFGKRSDASDSHDRYANMEIGYLLERLEKYDGIAILATNRKENIDKAFLRRIRFIIEFPSSGR